MPGWQQDSGLLDLVNGLPARPRPQGVLFAPGPAADYQNPGAMLPDLQEAGGSSVRNFPVPSSIARLSLGQLPAANPAAAATTGDAGLPAPSFGGPRLPQIFNGGTEQSPDIAIPATGGSSPGPGYRRTISADGGPTFWQAVRPEDRGVNGQDLLRQGTSVAEITAAHPGWSASQQLDLYRQLQHDAAGAARQNFAVGNESANQNAGIMSNADRVASQVANARTTEANTGATHERNQLPSAVILQGGGPQEVQDAMEALRAGSAPGAAAPGGGPTGPTSALQRILDQHLQSAAGIAPQQGVGPRIPVTLPAATTRLDANKAITNFMHSVSSAGLLTPENLPAVMSYMVQRMRSNNVDPWFAERFGGLSGSGQEGHREAVQRLQDVMNQRGVNVGNTGRSFRIGGPVGAVGQGIRDAIGGLFGQ